MSESDPRVEALTAWLSENLTWSTFMGSPDGDIADAIVAFLDTVAAQPAALDDLTSRLRAKAETLDEMATKEESFERTRLRGKAEGVRLALSFVDELRRGVS